MAGNGALQAPSLAHFASQQINSIAASAIAGGLTLSLAGSILFAEGIVCLVIQ